MTVHDTQNPETREAALAAAVDAVRGGGLIVLPTDTVYGIGADAFTPEAVQALLEAKGRGRDTPPPVLIGDHAVLLALATDVPDYIEDLTEELWPGALTVILTAQPSLTWDLGETRGSVALRMPEDEVALELLRRTGPLAVSSANRHGRPAAQSVLDAATQLGDSVEIYLDGGPARLGESSTILDATVTPPEIVREGAITKEQIIAVVGDIFTAPEPEPEAEETSAAGPDSGAADGSETVDGTESADGTGTGEGAAATAGEVSVQEAAETEATDEGSADSTAHGADATAAAPAAEEPSTSVLDLPSEPEPTAAAEAPAETPLSAPGAQEAAPTGTPAAEDDGSESTPG